MSVAESPPAATTQRAVWDLLETCAIPRDGALVVHSAFSSLADVGHRAEDAVAAMVDYMSPGTLLMPAMSWRSVNPDNPVFDELRTPGITGVLSEVFRIAHATRRSLHPTHSVAARGRFADDMLAFHHLDDTPCAGRSPWGLLDDFDGHVLLLGVNMERCTLVHHAEETVAPEIYLTPPEARERYTCIDRHGKTHVMHTRRHPRLPRNFRQFETVLEGLGLMHHATVAGTPCMAFAAEDLVRAVTQALVRQPDLIIKTGS